jgi:hypothetical protein
MGIKSENSAVAKGSDSTIRGDGGDFEEQLIKMPFVTGLCTTSAYLLGILLTEFPAPLSNGFVGKYNATGEGAIITRQTRLSHGRGSSRAFQNVSSISVIRKGRSA